MKGKHAAKKHRGQGQEFPLRELITLIRSDVIPQLRPFFEPSQKNQVMQFLPFRLTSGIILFHPTCQSDCRSCHRS